MGDRRERGVAIVRDRRKDVAPGRGIALPRRISFHCRKKRVIRVGR